jgi:hypothetical protein
MKRLAVIIFVSVFAIAAISALDPGVASAKKPFVRARHVVKSWRVKLAKPARQMLRSFRVKLARLPARAVGSFDRRNSDGVLSQRAQYLLRGLDKVQDRGRASLMRHGLETGRLRRDVQEKLIEAGKRNISYELVDRLSRY